MGWRGLSLRRETCGPLADGSGLAEGFECWPYDFPGYLEARHDIQKLR